MTVLCENYYLSNYLYLLPTIEDYLIFDSYLHYLQLFLRYLQF